MAATMRDVAALAGVSVKTVSRVVNLEPHTRPEVVRRVRAAIAELEWVPNGSARTLRTGRTGVIGVGVSELRRPYLSMITEAVVSELTRRGLQATVEPTHDQPDRLAALLAARGRLFDGLVLIGPADPAAPTALAALVPTDAVVLVHHGETAVADSVDPDLVEAASLVARHLVVMGRSRPALVGQDRTAHGDESMTAAFLAAGIAAPALRVDGVTSRADGARAATELLAADPQIDALVCGSDELALGALYALLGSGVAVPDQVAVFGFDNLDDASFSTPSLTTVDPGAARLARAAVELLADRLAGTGGDMARRVISPVELVRRESTLGAGLR
ncbi:LacI family DNA-binding transcriptional regulator [Sanguibacter inulinus]|uniref:LacI family DNA-binding transcriptional regulator n=1 Tax=Sanguibacter inulinus TaxID=60922 RepID=A0A853EUT1_9MICO|nr:LacI family DNA-binding transcriptional regulator [Sanguibacter inulinus]MBF0723065.1 LacI family DNA-binding transcriptional regulator [Sanguibacter inulinus]NYS94210.1 LacI family DNA-binding transcriptional regulator [Sanguibacter inulinus]